MGLDGAIKELCRTSLAPRAWIDRVPRQMGRRCIRVVDDLTQLRKWMGPKFDYKYTGQQLYESWRVAIDCCLLQGPYSVLILCMDDQSRVPALKHREQKNRGLQRQKSDAKNPEKAAPKWDTRKAFITDDGFWDIEAKTTSLIDIRSCLNSRWGRTDLYKWFMWKLEQDKTFRMPEGKLLILDFTAGGAFVYGSENPTFVQTAAYAHPFGEADLAMIYWCHVFRRCDAEIETIDSDVLAIVPTYLQYCADAEDAWRQEEALFEGKLTACPTARLGNIYWTYKISKDNEGIVDMAVLRTSLIQQGWDILHGWLPACICCETDFCFKKEMFNGIGASFILKGVKEKQDLFKSVHSVFHQPTSSITEDNEVKQEPLDAVQTQLNRRSITHIQEVVHTVRIRKNAKKATQPSYLEVHKWIPTFIDNRTYWNQDWKRFDVLKSGG